MDRDAGDLKTELRDRLELVHRLTDEFFAPTGGEQEVESPLTESLQSATEAWYSYPALRSPRAGQIFERIKPELLRRIGQSDRPEEALEQFDHFLSRLPAGVQLFSLFQANPQRNHRQSREGRE